MAYRAGYVGQDRFDRQAGGSDSFNRVFGRDQGRASGCRGCGYNKTGHDYGSPAPSYSPCKPCGYRGAISSRGSSIQGEIIEEEPANPQYGERRVKKLVHVPVTREVKVPTVVEKVVETTEVKEFPVKRVRQEQAFRTVQEEYVDYEEREATRMKEIWVKKEVPETYTERVPVTKTRSVEVPYTKTHEYTEIQRVEVPTTHVIEEPGYRVDEVVEYETREIEGKQKIEWVPRIVDEWSEERDLGVRDRKVVDRRIGTQVYPDHDGFAPNSHIGGRAIGGRSCYPELTQWDRSCGDSHFGLFVKESVVGLVVKSVEPGSCAAEAGLAPGDIIHSVDGLEVYSLEEFRRAINRKRAVTLAYRSKRVSRNLKTVLSY